MKLKFATSSVLAFSVGVIVIISAIYLIQTGKRSSLAPSVQTLQMTIKDGWTPLGGSWRDSDGTIENDSEERGAKLMYGFTSWHNYYIETDVQLLGSSGDAGIIIRGNGEEEGVDSYHGYFAGIRNKDDVSFFGRADFGWDQYASVPMPSPVEVGHWYHMTLVAFECNIASSVRDEAGHVTRISVMDSNCISAGRLGLKSYSSAARWRNIRIGPADRGIFEAVSDHATPVIIGAERTPIAMGFTDKALDRYIGPIRREARKQQFNQDTRSIASLKLLTPESQTQAAIRGVVTITSPVIYIQDSTGSIAVQANDAAVPVKIGDEVEARGLVLMQDYNPVLTRADFRPLWPNVPLAPLAVSTFELAAGGHSGEFVELAGTLVARNHSSNRTTQITLSDDTQRFYVISDSSTIENWLRGVPLGSRLLVRGVVTYAPDFTLSVVPFVLLLPSSASIEVIARPSWWNSFHITLVVVCGLLLILAFHTLLIRIQRWRLRSVLNERERLALDMHDTLAQSFAGIGYQLEAVRDETLLPEPSRRHVEVAIAMVHSSHEEAKRSISALRPNYLGKSDLIEALTEYANQLIEGRSISINSSVKGKPVSLQLSLTDAMFRIGQEAISNAIRHGRPSSISIQLEFEGNNARLICQDDGTGFDTNDRQVGLGIRGMEKRARDARAVLNIVSFTGRGTTVTLAATIHSQRTVLQRLEMILDFFSGA